MWELKRMMRKKDMIDWETEEGREVGEMELIDEDGLEEEKKKTLLKRLKEIYTRERGER